MQLHCIVTTYTELRFSSDKYMLQNIEKKISMNIIKACKTSNQLFLHHHFNSETRAKAPIDNIALTHSRGMKVGVVRASSGSGEGVKPEKPSFLSYQEAGIVEMSGLVSHEKFLCRLTISSLNLLRVISEQEGCSIEELNAGRICDWFLKDKLKSEQNLDTAVLQWDDSDLQL